jgi:hypothetical protein
MESQALRRRNADARKPLKKAGPRRGCPSRAEGYEVLRLKVQDAWVVCTLPHVRAMVSKTRS